ncbi:MAG: hypothetical protein LQ342_003150 [Letrouitia transgressa]|nr:MAG: hypothetical protein LQ342_003150 [Letrouitia transgressa]
MRLSLPLTSTLLLPRRIAACPSIFRISHPACNVLTPPAAPPPRTFEPTNFTFRKFSTSSAMSNRYAAVHANSKGPGDARPTALDIVKDEGLEGKLGDKVVLITGCSSGLGVETAKAIAATGARLFLTVRDMAKGERVVGEILKPGHVELVQMDLNSLDSVRAAAKEVQSKTKTLDILINNAGIMAVPTLTHTQDGFESQFGTNHLAHFLLFQLLKPLLLSSTPSRVVCLSSSGHRAGGINAPDYNFSQGGYSAFAAYGQSKTANLYMANEIDRRYGSQGLHALSLHPGGIATGLQKHMPDSVKRSWEEPSIKNYMKSTAQGAATSVYAALSKEWEGRGGRFLEDCAEAPPVDPMGGPMAVGWAPHAFDEKAAKRLWTDSCRMVGVADDA